jgi:hypothetical protein
VQQALEEFVRRIQARQILDLAGSGLWVVELGEMRKDVRLNQTYELADP